MKVRQSRERIVWLIISLLIVFKLWLVQGQALIANPQFPHDDLLFMRLAEYLVQGQWLGPYDNLTLSKGPFYPLWIAASFRIGLPLLFSQHLLYAGASLVLVLAVRPWMARRGVLLAVYALLLFNPISYGWWVGNRVIRAGVYPALALLALACGLGLAGRASAGWRRSAPWALGMGLSLAAFWMTREEGIWLLPSLGLLALFSIVNQTLRVSMASKNDRDNLQPHKPIRKVVVKILRVTGSGWLFGLLVFTLTVGAVAAQNYRRYGLFAKSEMDAHPFKAAYGAVLRVAPSRLKPYISQETLRQIFDASPAFAELAPYLGGEKGRIWALEGGSEAGENNFVGGVFIWALRDAVAEAGYYSSGKFPVDYYRTVAAEINMACEAGQLDCLPSRASLAPPWQNAYFEPLLRNSYKAALRLVRFGGLGPWPVAAPPDSPATRLFLELSGERLYGLGERMVVEGWMVHEEAVLVFQVRAAGGQLAETSIEQLDSPDVYAFFLENGVDLPQAHTARFRLETPCSRGCTLEAWSEGELAQAWSLDTIKAGGGSQRAAVKYYFEVIEREVELPTQAQAATSKDYVLRRIDRIYQWGNPILAFLGLVAYAGCSWAVIRRKLPAANWLTLSAFLLAIVAMVGLVAYVETTAFRAIQTVYLAPVYPLMLAFEGLAIGCGFDYFFAANKQNPEV